MDIPHCAGKEPYKEPAKVKVISLGATPIKFFQLSKPIQAKEEWPPLKIDLTMSPPATKPPIEKEQEQTGKEQEKADKERIDLTKSPARESPSDKSKENTQGKEEKCAAWKRNMMNIKHKAARQVHQHTVETAPQVGAQFTELLEKASLQSLPSFLAPDAMNKALTEAMTGLSKLAAMTILRNATSKVAKNVNTECVVQLMLEKNTLVQKNEELVGTQGKLRNEESTLSAEVEELKTKYKVAQESETKHKADLDKELSSGKVKADNLVALQVRLADAMGEKQALETKVKDLKDELTNAQNDLWNTDDKADEKPIGSK